MKKQIFVMGLIISFLIPGTFTEAQEQKGHGKIEFTQKDDDQGLSDPENPQKPVNPGNPQPNKGNLRIDFVPEFNFWAHKRTKKEEIYYGNAQLFHDNTNARGNYVQVTDNRGTGKGWRLQIRQETQLKNDTTKNKELNGAVISLDNSWTNSTRSLNEAPLVSKDVIKIDNIGQTYDLAEAKRGKGQGTWFIIFGASKENSIGMKETLSPRVNEAGKQLTDSSFGNKPVYENSALSLSIPVKTERDPVTYQTVISWILSELP